MKISVRVLENHNKSYWQHKSTCRKFKQFQLGKQNATQIMIFFRHYMWAENNEGPVGNQEKKEGKYIYLDAWNDQISINKKFENS